MKKTRPVSQLANFERICQFVDSLLEVTILDILDEPHPLQPSKNPWNLIKTIKAKRRTQKKAALCRSNSGCGQPGVFANGTFCPFGLKMCTDLGGLTNHRVAQLSHEGYNYSPTTNEMIWLVKRYPLWASIIPSQLGCINPLDLSNSFSWRFKWN